MSDFNTQSVEPEHQIAQPVAATARLVRAEIDTQVSTAKSYPRQITKFLRESVDLACRDQATAQSMFYSVPRANKSIVGPSVRLAEIMSCTWTNLRAECRFVEYRESTHTVVVEAVCWDMETNTAIKIQKERRAEKKRNMPKPDADMIQLAMNAAMSIALRDAIFRVVPRAYVNQVFEQAKKTALGKAKSIKDTVAEVMAEAAKFGVSEERVIAAVEGATSREDIGLDEVIYIRGLFTTAKEGEVALEDLFPDPKAEKKTLKDRVTDAKPEAQQQKPKEDAKPEEKTAPVDKVEEKPQEREPGDDGDGEPEPEWVAKRRGLFADIRAVDKMRLPLSELLAERHKADAAEEHWWEVLIKNAVEHTLSLCSKASLVPIAKSQIESTLKGYPHLDELVAMATLKQESFAK